MGGASWKFFVFCLCYAQLGAAEPRRLTVLANQQLCLRSLRILATMSQEATGKPPGLDDREEARSVLSNAIKELDERNPDLAEAEVSDSDTVTYFAFPNPDIANFLDFPNPGWRGDKTPKYGAISLAHPRRLESRVWARSSSAAETRGKLAKVQSDLDPKSKQPTFATVLHGSDAQRFIARLIATSLPETREVQTAPSSDARDRYGLWQATSQFHPLLDRAKWFLPLSATLALPVVESPDLRTAIGLGAAMLTTVFVVRYFGQKSDKVKYLENPVVPSALGPSDTTARRYPTLLPKDQLGSVLFHAANQSRELSSWRRNLWRYFLPDFKKRRHGDWVVYSHRDPETKVDFTLLYEIGADDRVVLVARGDNANPRTLVEQLGVQLKQGIGGAADEGEVEFFRAGAAR